MGVSVPALHFKLRQQRLRLGGVAAANKVKEKDEPSSVCGVEKPKVIGIP
jgi:hypothetical protein